MGLIRGAYGTGLLCVLATAPAVAHADFYLHPWENFRNEEKRLHLIATARMYSTSANFTASGDPVDVSAQEGYTRIESDGLVSHALNSRLTGFARLSWAMVSLNRASGTDSSFGLTDQTIGINYRLSPVPKEGPGEPAHGLAIDLQLQLEIPAYKAEPENNLPPLGDGSFNASMGAFATLPLGGLGSGSLRTRAGAAFTFRNSEYSSLLPWSAWLEYDPEPSPTRGVDPNGSLLRDSGLMAAIGGFGILSMDKTTSPNNASAAAATFAAGAPNPSLMAAGGKLGYRFTGGTTLTATGAQAVWGEVAPKGFLAYITIDLALGRAAPSRDPIKLAPKVYGAANKGFVNYTLEARVLRVSDRLAQIRIDRGSQDGVEVGQLFDIFVTKPDGTTGEGVARCKVISVRQQESSLSIVEHFREIWIDEGFVARRLIQ